MASPQTIFILGAGASVPYGLPTGAELRKDIFNGHHQKTEEVITLYHENMVALPLTSEMKKQIKIASKFASEFRLSQTPMIDLYLNRNSKLMQEGLRAIIMSILAHEVRCRYGEDAPGKSGDWYSWLQNRLIGDFSHPESLDLSSANIGFITFNYDRTLENFFYETLTRAFSEIPESEIIRELQSIPIEHVFGKIAPLPWEGANNPLDFRTPLKKLSFGRIDELTQNIRISYGDRSNSNHERIRELISQAERIIFLGFGYDHNNLKLLGFPAVLKNLKNALGTSLGKRSKDISDIQQKFFPGSGRSYGAVFQEVDCLQLLINDY